MKSGDLNFLEPSGPLQACNGTAWYIYIYIYIYTHTHTHTLYKNTHAHTHTHTHTRVFRTKTRTHVCVCVFLYNCDILILVSRCLWAVSLLSSIDIESYIDLRGNGSINFLKMIPKCLRIYTPPYFSQNWFSMLRSFWSIVGKRTCSW